MDTGPDNKTRRKRPGLVVAGAHSGSGKTTVALGLMAALRKRGLAVAPFKVGPDFIDPGHHGRVAGRKSRNLDGWMLSRETNVRIFEKAVSDADIAVVEGVMGMYDGYDGLSEAGSTAQMAKWLGLPILLVVNAKSMARSAAALVFGFTRFDPDCSFCGVVFNNVGSPRHLEYLRQALENRDMPPVLGGFPRKGEIEIPERHLGLVTAEDHDLTESRMAALANFVEESLDIDTLMESLSLFPPLAPDAPDSRRSEPSPIGKSANALRVIGQETWAVERKARIGVARDNAFCFYYPENIEELEKNGAEIVFFSPAEDRALPENLDGLYFGGGYPELHAKRLSENESVRRAVLKKCEDGMPIYAECGGFMYLCEKLIVKDGTAFEMAGCFPFETRMQDRLTSLGYREITLSADSPIGEAGVVARGHEFHYSRLEEENRPKKLDPLSVEEFRDIYGTTDRTGNTRTCPGYLVNRCLGSYVHLHFKSSPGIGRNFVSACQAYRKER